MGRGSRRGPGGYDPDEELYDDEYEYERRPRRRAYASTRPYPPAPRPRRRRRIWPAILLGCGLGIVFTVIAAAVVVFLAFRTSQGNALPLGPMASTQTYTHEDTTQTPLSTINQMQICDKIGNVNIQVDNELNTPTIVAKKIVHTHSQAEAEQEFKRIAIEAQPPSTIGNALTCTKSTISTPATASGATPATGAGIPQGSTTSPATPAANTLTLNVIMPDDDGMWHASSDAVDLTIKLPQSALPDNGPTMLLNVEAPVGNISIDGLSGVLDIKGSTGDVNISHGVLADGSHIETGEGNISFSGLLLAGTTSNAGARYYIQNEQGNIDVTLPGNDNVTLDANTNVGALHSDFNIPVNNNGGPVNYHGPLNPAGGTASPAVLLLDVSTGNITIHKAA